jgi:mRNA interferase HicA
LRSFVTSGVALVWAEDKDGKQNRNKSRASLPAMTSMLADAPSSIEELRRHPGTVAIRTFVFDTGSVKGSEFLRLLKAMARDRRIPYRWDQSRGSGSHGTVYFGGRFTVVKDLKKEIGPGLLADMCQQLGIRKEDLFK